MKNFLTIIFVISLALQSAYSWGLFGHLLVAQIAEDELLKQEPQLYANISKVVGAINSLVDQNNQNFVETSKWPDDIIGLDFKFLNEWHYKDIMIDPTKPPVEPSNEITENSYVENAKEANGDVVFGIEQCKKVIETSGLKLTFSNALMTRYLIHLVGDSHQPLHGAALVNSEFPTGDLGGNLYKVTTVEGKTENLHHFWDAGCLKWDGLVNRPLNATGKKYLQDFAKSITTQFPRANFEKELKKKAPLDWVKESQYHAWTYAYKPLLESATPKKLTQSYMETCDTISKKRVAMAGYRLTDALISYFKAGIKNQENQSKEEEIRMEEF